MNKHSPRNSRFRQNTNKEKALPAFEFIHGIEVALKIVMVAILVSLTTLFFIFIENTIVQSNFLAIKEISVSGTNILSKEEVIEQAELYPEDNIFSVNLRHTRLRIISHPWIEDASVKRSLPSKIIITIKEESPLAVVHIPDKADIILNRKGVPFTENDAIGSDIYVNDIRNSTGMVNIDVNNSNSFDNNNKIDNDNKIINTQNRANETENQSNKIESQSKNDNANIILPVITGLTLSNNGELYGFFGKLYESVIYLLLMKQDYVIQKISADEESGLEIDMVINSTPKIKPVMTMLQDGLPLSDVIQQQPIPLVSNPVRVKIGFDNYNEKFKIIRHIINYMQKNRIEKQVWSIDLINTENVVIKVKDITGNGLPKGINAMPEHIDGGA
ncbi:MAG: FtsQ-type POTRA domain-containing protein [Desulfamplus sp.]|nr:FtsQ-type POTRA domain-containing protein [Desulfamplus sp.]